MSVQAISWVLDHSTTRGTDRLVLVAIANHAGSSPKGDVWEAWPGVARLAREAGLDRVRTVQQALARLESGGHIQRVVNGAPDGRIRPDRRPNLYRIVVPDGVTLPDTPSDSRGDAWESNGVTPGSRTGCSEATPEPSLNRQGTKQLSEAVVAWADLVTAQSHWVNNPATYARALVKGISPADREALGAKLAAGSSPSEAALAVASAMPPASADLDPTGQDAARTREQATRARLDAWAATKPADAHTAANEARANLKRRTEAEAS